MLVMTPQEQERLFERFLMWCSPDYAEDLDPLEVETAACLSDGVDADDVDFLREWLLEAMAWLGAPVSIDDIYAFAGRVVNGEEDIR